MNGVNKKEEPSPFSLHRNISANKFIARKFTANDKYSFWQKRREEKKEKKGKEKEEDSSIEATTQKKRKKERKNIPFAHQLFKDYAIHYIGCTIKLS